MYVHLRDSLPEAAEAAGRALEPIPPTTSPAVSFCPEFREIRGDLAQAFTAWRNRSAIRIVQGNEAARLERASTDATATRIDLAGIHWLTPALASPPADPFTQE